MTAWNRSVWGLAIALESRREIQEMVHNEQFKAALTITKSEIIVFRGGTPRTARKANEQS